MLSCNDAPLCQSFGRPKEGRRNTCLRQLSCLLAGSVTLTSFWSPGAAGRNSVPPEDGLVTQLWPGFSRATPVLRTIRLWVIITLAFTPKFSCVYFTPQTLQSVCFLGPLGFFCCLFSCCHFMLSSTPAAAGPATATCLCFSWRQSRCHYCCFFWDTSSCGESSFPVIIALSSNFN